jgi:hypothetical protein
MDKRVEGFDAIWRAHWGEETQAIGWALRGSHAWCRFHTLPDSKRYPATDAEMEVILNRHFTLLTEVLHQGALGWVRR